jgi:hypothetical protein
LDAIFLAAESPEETGFDTEDLQDQIIVDYPSPSVPPSQSPTPSLTPSNTPSPTPSITSSVSPTPFPSITLTPSITKTPNPTPTTTPTPSVTSTPLPVITNTSFANFFYYDLAEILFITNEGEGGSNIPPYNKQGYEYVNNTVINKALMKLMINNRTLSNYLNYKFTGILNPETNEITSGDILPLNKEQKDLLNTAFSNNCYVNINEKTAPQVMNRVMTCLYESSNVIANLTNLEITNLNDLLNTLNNIIPFTTPTASPSITPSVSNTPSVTPSVTSTPSLTPSPTRSPRPSITPTPSITPSNSPPLGPTGCKLYLITSNNISCVVTFTGCGDTTETTLVLGDGTTICTNGSEPVVDGGNAIDLNTLCYQDQSPDTGFTGGFSIEDTLIQPTDLD